MRRALPLSIGFAIAVAFASRLGEWAFSRFVSSELLQNIVGMSVAGVTAGVLFFLWRRQQHEKIRLLRERERAVRHVHHHVRNSLQVIVNRHHEDPLVVQQVERIIREMELALPRQRSRSHRSGLPDESENPR